MAVNYCGLARFALSTITHIVSVTFVFSQEGSGGRMREEDGGRERVKGRDVSLHASLHAQL